MPPKMKTDAAKPAAKMKPVAALKLTGKKPADKALKSDAPMKPTASLAKVKKMKSVAPLKRTAKMP